MQVESINYAIAVVEFYRTTSDRRRRNKGCGLRVLSDAYFIRQLITSQQLTAHNGVSREGPKTDGNAKMSVKMSVGVVH